MNLQGFVWNKDDLPKLQEQLTRVLAAFEILAAELKPLGYIDIGPELGKSREKVKAALYDVVVRKEVPWWLA